MALSTAIYVLLWQLEAPFWEWAVVSMLLGLGFTFFSGAVEAWLVDALNATGFDGDLESVFGRGQIVSGIAMLTGSVAGGLIAQATSLGVPFVVRAGVLAVMFVVAYRLMHDVGFSPERRQRPLAEMRRITSNSIEYGWRVPAVKWLMLSSLFSGGVGFYAFYALQPYLLELYGDPTAYSIAGLVAAIVAGAQILGGIAAPRIRRVFERRTSALIGMSTVGVAALALIGVIEVFAAVIALIVVWGLVFAAEMPIRQAYINCMIPSKQRATILSFDSLMSSTGGVWAQPVLGRVRGRLGLRALLSAQRRDRRARDPVHLALAPRARPGRHDGRHPRRRGRAGARARARGDLSDYSSSPSLARRLTTSSSSATTSGSRSVVTSPSSRPSAMSRSSRRMILPERVFGRSSAQIDPPRTRQLADPLGDVLAQLGDQLVGALEVALEGDEGADRLAGVFVGLTDHRRLGDLGVADDRRLDLGGREPVPGDVDHVVDPADHPDVPVGVLARRVADEIRPRAELREVGLDVALVVAIERPQHPRPRPAQGEQPLLADHLVALLVENRGLDSRERRARRAGL